MKMMMKYIVRMAISVLVMAFCASTGYALDKSFYADSSRLATGKWVKISVTESGIYQITAEDIRTWGLGSDLSQIHVFGYGGAPLSERMRGDNYADDLPQVPIVRTGDRILFYGQGNLTWNTLDTLNRDAFEQLQVQHPYSKTGSYLITNDSRYRDIEVETATNDVYGKVVTTFTERLFHEQELINPGETGRAFLGESFLNSRSQTFKFTLDDLVSGSTVKAYTVFASQTLDKKSSISLTVNNDNQLPVTNGEVIDTIKSLSHDHYKLCNSLQSFKLDGTNELNYTVKYIYSGTPHLARLDFITVNYERNLKLKNGSLVFGMESANSATTYRISGAGSTTRVWDVTCPYAPVQMAAKNGDGNVDFTPDTDGRREFVAFDESGSFKRPKLVGEVSNQNIHGELTPDMIIIAHSAYLEQARRVAALHEEQDGFRVLVIDHEKVYNEFSSGTRDAMAYRRMCKMFYDRGKSNDGHSLSYLLLMGGGSYNNRLIGVDSVALNYPSLLTWQTPRGDMEDYSITTDDYFGILGDGSSISNADKMNISVGRLPVRNVSEARTAVNKLEKYLTKPDYGAWKNQVMFVADDDNFGDHMTQSKDMIQIIRENGGDNTLVSYVFIDAFNSVSQGGARNYPDARNKMFTTLNEGVLWWNYIGHASTQNWTGEGLMMRSDVETRLFYRHIPVLYAATCEFTRFDGSVPSSGEHIFLNPNGGAVTVVCPARLAYIQYNGSFGNKVARYIFSQDENGRQRRIGDIIRMAKNESSATDNHRRFFVIGDPAMRLAWAPYTAQIETINGNAVDSEHMPVFKARQQVEFSGKIVDLKGELATNFNGNIISTLFGPEQSVTTHGNGEQGRKVTYQDRPNRLAINVDSVNNGRFTVRVVIPSEINNEYDNYSPSLINLYAYDSSDTLEAKGANSDFYIYGYEDEAVTDTIGPKIITFGLNNETFVDGSDVNESPLVLATVSDESGVNFSSAGIGHSMTLTLDGTNSYNDLVSYYTPMVADVGTLGSINYQLNDLTSGKHTLRLRVWDVYNNMSEKTISFNVVKGLAPEIADIYCGNNPASSEAAFYVKHNRPDAVVSVTIEVYDLMGRRIWSATQAGRSDMYNSIPINWDLIDSAGRRVPRGIYIYRATITTDGVKEATMSKKLAVAAE